MKRILPNESEFVIYNRIYFIDSIYKKNVVRKLWTIYTTVK